MLIITDAGRLRFQSDISHKDTENTEKKADAFMPGFRQEQVWEALRNILLPGSSFPAARFGLANPAGFPLP